MEDDLGEVYRSAATTDIDAALRRSQIAGASYELKQGPLRLSPLREVDDGVIAKVVLTTCGIANIGPTSSGLVLIGVTDKDDDAARISELDGISPRVVAVVGWSGLGVKPLFSVSR